MLVCSGLTDHVLVYRPDLAAAGRRRRTPERSCTPVLCHQGTKDSTKDTKGFGFSEPQNLWPLFFFVPLCPCGRFEIRSPVDSRYAKHSRPSVYPETIRCLKE